MTNYIEFRNNRNNQIGYFVSLFDFTSEGSLILLPFNETEFRTKFSLPKSQPNQEIEIRNNLEAALSENDFNFLYGLFEKKFPDVKFKKYLRGL